MTLKKVLIALSVLIFLIGAVYSYGWIGFFAVSGALVMWILLHFNRLIQVLKRTSNRPVGYVDSAVMLNAKLQMGVSLLHVLALTKSIGETIKIESTSSESLSSALSQSVWQSFKTMQSLEVYRWTDNSQSHVTAHFQNGKLIFWQFARPESESSNENLKAHENNASQS